MINRDELQGVANTIGRTPDELETDCILDWLQAAVNGYYALANTWNLKTKTS